MNTTTRKHFCIDGYKADRDALAEIDKMSKLLGLIGDQYFVDSYQMRTIPSLQNANYKLDGVSGVILGLGAHFTLHTFSNIGAFFMDYYGDCATQAMKAVPQQLQNVFEPLRIDACESHRRSGNFGRHLVFERRPLEFSQAFALVKEIVTTINMTPLGQALSQQSDDSYSIIQPIAESHISVHQSPEQPTRIDIFSCRYFDDTELWQLVGAKPKIEIQRGIFLPPDWKE